MIRRIVGTVLGLSVGLAGCATDPTESWSSKSQSVGGSSAASGRPLALPASVGQPSPVKPTAGPPLATELGPVVLPPPTLRRQATDLLVAASDSDSALLRANSIEALQQAPAHLEPVVRRGLVDENRAVRFVAAMTIGQFRMEHLAHLLQPLLQDESESVRAAAIYGLKRCDQPVDLTPLASMLVSEDPEVRGNAAMVLGGLGNPTAVPMIRQWF